MPGTTKRVATVVWSISIAVVLLVLTTSVMLPSTKRARISFDENERAAATQPVESRRSHFPSSKSNNFDFAGKDVLYAPATQPQEKWDWGPTSQPDIAISSSKSGVFRIQPSVSTTKPTHIFGSKAAVFDIEKTGILATDDSTTQPSTAPSR